MSKQGYRAMLNDIKDVVKLSSCASALGISKSALSYFMKGSEYDMMLSTDKLEMLIDYIKDKLSCL